MTVEQLFDVLKKNLILLIVTTIAGAAIASGYVLCKRPVYTAAATVYVTVDFNIDSAEPSSVSIYNFASQLTLQKAEAYLPLFSDRSTAAEVKSRLGLSETVDNLTNAVAAENVKNTSTIKVSARADSIEIAQQLADSAAQVVSERIQELEGSASPVRLKLLSSATLNNPEKSPIMSKMVPIGILVGLFVGLLIAMVRAQRDTKIRLPRDLEEISNIPILSSVPISSEIADYANDGQAFEYVRKVRTSLAYTAVDRDLRSILITSSLPSEGKSSIAAALSKVIAYSGKKVLLIDVDLRYPTVAPRFNLATKIGLTHVLSGSITVDDAVQKTDTEGLYILPAGDSVPNPSELLGSNRMEDLLLELQNEYIVILDAPPVIPVTDSVILSSRTAATIVVVGAGVATVDGVTQTIGALTNSNAYLAGFVLNLIDNKVLPNSKYGNKYSQFHDIKS